MTKCILLPVSVLFFSTAAAAADFTGPRVEARIGWDRVSLSIDAADQRVFSEKASGLAYGGELGYDFATGGAVLGAYGGLELTTAKFCLEGFDEEDCLKVRRNITAGLRGGVIAAPGTLIYAKGGYSNGKVGFSGEEDDGDGSRSRGGYHLGAGAEFEVGGGAYLRGEYVFTSYSRITDEEDDSVRGRLRRHQILAGIGVRF